MNIKKVMAILTYHFVPQKIIDLPVRTTSTYQFVPPLPNTNIQHVEGLLYKRFIIIYNTWLSKRTNGLNVM